MPLIVLIVGLAVLGVVLWLVNTKVPMPGWVKQVINVIAIIGVVIFLLKAFGLWDMLFQIRV